MRVKLKSKVIAGDSLHREIMHNGEIRHLADEVAEMLIRNGAAVRLEGLIEIEDGGIDSAIRKSGGGENG